MLGAFSYFLDGMSGGDAAHAATGVVTTQDARTRGSVFNSQPEVGAAELLLKNKKKRKSPLELLLTPAIPLVQALTPCNRGRCVDTGNSTGILGCAVLESALGNFKKMPLQ